MSLETFTDIWENSPQGGEKLLVLLTIADGSDYTSASMVHAEYVAKMARVSVEHLFELLDEMKQTGDIDIYSRATDALGVKLLKPWLQKNTSSLASLAFMGFDDSYKDQITGYVYLIQCGEYFKIGQTTNVSKRMLQLGLQLPHKPKVLHIIGTDDHEGLERSLHQCFSLHRLNGEWFSLESEHIKTFKRYGCSDNNDGFDQFDSHIYLDGQGYHIAQSFMPI